MDPIAILQNRIELLEAKLGVASSQQSGDSRVVGGDSVAANLMSAHAAMASGAAGHEKVTAAMAQATELNNYTSPDVMQHMQQRQMQMHEVAAAEPAIRHHCHCMHRCKQAAPALESDVIAQVPQMQDTVDHMKADTIRIKSDADAQSQLYSPRPNFQENGNVQMPPVMQPQMEMQGNPNTMNVNSVYNATVHNSTPFQGHPNAMTGNPPAQVEHNAMHGNTNHRRGNINTPNGNSNAAPNEWQRNRLSMFGGHDVASAMRGNPTDNIAVHGKDMHGNPKVRYENVIHEARDVVPNEMHGNHHTQHAPTVMNGNPLVHGNVDDVAGHASVPYTHPGHVHPNAMAHPEHVHSNGMTQPENVNSNAAMPQPEHVHTNAMPNAYHAHPNSLPHAGQVYPNAMPHTEHVQSNAIHAHTNAMPHAGHVNPNAMPHSQMVPGNHETHAPYENVTLSGHVANQNAQPASPRSPVPEVTQGIQQLAESCGATAGIASEQLASVTQKVEQAEQRKIQRRNGLD